MHCIGGNPVSFKSYKCSPHKVYGALKCCLCRQRTRFWYASIFTAGLWHTLTKVGQHLREIFFSSASLDPFAHCYKLTSFFINRCLLCICIYSYESYSTPHGLPSVFFVHGALLPNGNCMRLFLSLTVLPKILFSYRVIGFVGYLAGGITK